MLFIQIALQIRKTWRKKNKKHAVRCHGEVTKVRLAYWRSESNLYSERLIIKVPDSTPRRNPGCVYRLDRDRRWLIFSLLCQGLSFFRKRSAGRVLFISFPSSAHVPDDIPDLSSGFSSSSCRVCTPVYSCGFVAGPWELFDFFFFPQKKKNSYKNPLSIRSESHSNPAPCPSRVCGILSDRKRVYGWSFLRRTIEACQFSQHVRRVWMERRIRRIVTY